MSEITFTGQDGQEYIFPFSFADQALPLNQYEILKRFIALSQQYDQGQGSPMPMPLHFDLLADFTDVFWELIAWDFCRAFPGHKLSGEYNIIYGLSARGKQWLAALVGEKLEALIKQVLNLLAEPGEKALETPSPKKKKVKASA